MSGNRWTFVLDGAPGVGVEQIGEIAGQLLLRQIVDVVIEVGPDAADRSGIGRDSLRLQPLEPQMLQMGFVLAVEMGCERC